MLYRWLRASMIIGCAAVAAMNPLKTEPSGLMARTETKSLLARIVLRLS